MVWSSWQYFWRYFSQFIFSSFAKGLGLRFVIVSILFWLRELSLPVRGAWERGSSWGSTYTERERRHPKNNPPKKQSLSLSRTLRGPFPFRTTKAALPAVAAGRGAGGRRRAPGEPGGGSAPPGPLRAPRGLWRRVGAAGRCQPPDVCRALFANTWQVTGGRRGEAAASVPAAVRLARLQPPPL